MSIRACDVSLFDLQRVEDYAFQAKGGSASLKMPVRLGPMRKIAEGADIWRQSRICQCQRVEDNAFHLCETRALPILRAQRPSPSSVTEGKMFSYRAASPV